jgi:hypothetical protein
MIDPKDIEYLKRHNKWRRGDDTYPMSDPKELGECIDRIVEGFEKEKVESNSYCTPSDKGWSQMVINFDGHLKAEIETTDNAPKILRAVNGYGQKVDVAKISMSKI